MPHEVALSLVNDIKMKLAQLAQAVANTLHDGKVTPMEGMLLSMQGMQVATAVIMALQGRDKIIVEDILYLLEHGVLVVDDAMVAAVAAAEQHVAPVQPVLTQQAVTEEVAQTSQSPSDKASATSSSTEPATYSPRRK
jgi:hypothetical protein